MWTMFTNWLMPHEQQAASLPQIPNPNMRWYECVQCQVRGRGNECWYCDSNESLIR